MRLSKKCYQMQKTIETHLPHLSRPSARGGTGLVLWVYGAILAGSAGQNAVASAHSPWGRWNGRRQYPRGVALRSATGGRPRPSLPD